MKDSKLELDLIHYLADKYLQMRLRCMDKNGSRPIIGVDVSREEYYQSLVKMFRDMLNKYGYPLSTWEP
jgi:hypothetical protein